MFAARLLQNVQQRTKFLAGPATKRTRSLVLGGVLLSGTAAVGFGLATAVAAEPLQNDASVLDPNAFKSFKLSAVIDVNHNSKIFRFQLPNTKDKLDLPVASCVVTKAESGDGKPIIRPYTPLTATETGHFDLLVKKYPNGPMSTHIFNLKIGESLAVKGPIVKIPYKANFKREIGMIAGGTGITPMLQVLNEALKDPEDKTRFTLIFANVTEDDILLREDLETMQAKHPNFRVYYTIDKPSKSWKGDTGFVSKEMIEKYMPKPSPNSMIFVCGPSPMMAHISGPKAPDFSQGELSGILKELNYQKDNVFKF